MVILAAAIMVASCKKDVSNTTGWNYNDPNFGGFQNHPGGRYFRNGTCRAGCDARLEQYP